MKDRAKQFKDTLERYINYRGIDIILTLKDGTVIELDKNRKMKGDIVIKNGDFGIEAEIEISSIQKADFFAA
ncbi:hypothetical protein [Leptospira licerasiae]|uniref:Uncharacterized protein n=1 Tax=Leptospira licerasiae str. MMD4847 TaxID=1049971 RepID=A0ABN0H9N0_9LEPT|nr:hypothetical protein [Leptospira licerasiae]EIE01566.1 hypothetical protein LEP1GSC185_3015 [Leptospira licerasiae serovar Varillal str. VAR 010]EJZ42398.1 hypothetical protein LEP1GSC178_2633 [Leptospira licerasiae str. MMD4847]